LTPRRDWTAGVGRFSKLNGPARTRFDANKPPLGEPIAFTAEFVRELGTDGDKGPSFIVKQGEQEFLIEDALLIDAKAGDAVLVGGILTDRGDKNRSVLERGFAISDRAR
jgi:hypothetical protein